MKFDLNIDNYSDDEIIDIFGLKINYDKKLLEQQADKLTKQISQDLTLTEELKTSTINFINRAKNLILNKYLNKNTEIIEINNNVIQKQKITPYINSLPNEYFSGVINPLKKRTIIQNLNIDSRFRDNYHNSSPSNFNITLPIKINNVLQIQLTTFELPNVYYSISSQYNNNFFTIIINGIKETISIPFGNYNIVTIMDAINTVLSSKGAPFTYITFSANLNTIKTIIEPNGSGIVSSIELIFYEDDTNNICDPTIAQLTLGWLLGFRKYVYENELSYVSEGAIDLSGTKYFYLVLDDFNNNVNDNFIGAFKSSILNKNIIARISKQAITNDANSINVLFQDDFGLVAPPRQYFGPVNLLSFNVQLLDEYGRVVDLNNMNFNFCISLITIYDF
jgi:hypothetical protein